MERFTSLLIGLAGGIFAFFLLNSGVLLSPENTDNLITGAQSIGNNGFAVLTLLAGLGIFAWMYIQERTQHNEDNRTHWQQTLAILQEVKDYIPYQSVTPILATVYGRALRNETPLDDPVWRKVVTEYNRLAPDEYDIPTAPPDTPTGVKTEPMAVPQTANKQAAIASVRQMLGNNPDPALSRMLDDLDKS